jgi:hypothetical protein
MFALANSIDSPSGWLRTGVMVSTIERVYDGPLAVQISSQTQEKGKTEVEKDILD